ncbi:MAG TPA: DNA gyrase subunit A [Planctomycetota bacterium]|nr:DNA gyrase subunit A [Planctomycetota bacterium]
MSDQREPFGNDRPEGIRDQILDEELKSSYLTYAMSVIVQRALPDARDGLKPSQRRVLVAMNDLNLGPRAKFRKCAKITGDTTANYHPHGDQVVYPTLVRMAQDFNIRYPLVDKQGNFGAIDGSAPAAQRYTEARMSYAAVDLLDDLEKETVELARNYDDTRDEPTVLPGRFPNLLCNGSQGIAVGMATSIPPHNLVEVADAVIALLRNPEVEISELCRHIKGPDFPTGGIIMGRSGIGRAYATGRGQVVVRARAEIEQYGKDREQIVVTELPYQVSPIAVFEKVKDLIAEKTIDGITDINDETDRTEGLRLVFQVRRGVQADLVLNQLFRHTPLQSSFSIILLALSKGRPKTFTIKEMLEEFRDHRVDVIQRRTRFLKRKAEERLHIVLGLLVAIRNIDEVIRIIRESADTPTAREALMRAFDLSERQATAILEMRLARLTALEHGKLEEEQAELESQIRRFEQILGDVQEVYRLIVGEMEDLKQRYPGGRRTVIVEQEGEIEDESLIPNSRMLVVLSHQGYIKRMSPDLYRAQGRGGKGVSGADTKEGDFIERLIVADNHDTFLFFTTRGIVHWLKVYAIPELGRSSQGRFIENLLELRTSEGADGAEKEKIASILPVRNFDDRYLLTVSRQGFVKKTPLSEYGRPKKGGIIGAGLKDDDRLVRALITRGNDEILVSTAMGQTIRFHEEEVRPMGRPAAGVTGVRFKRENDYVVDADVADDAATLLTICAKGYGKRSRCADYPVKGRGTQGVQNITGLERNGLAVAARVVRPGDDVMVITKAGVVLRTPADTVRETGRGAMGVTVMNLEEGDEIVAAVLVAQAEESTDREGPPVAPDENRPRPAPDDESAPEGGSSDADAVPQDREES